MLSSQSMCCELFTGTSVKVVEKIAPSWAKLFIDRNRRCNSLWFWKCLRTKDTPFSLFFFFLKNFPSFEFMYLLCVSVLGLHCCTGFSLVVVNGGYSLTAMRRLLLIVVTSRCRAWTLGHGLQYLWPQALEHRLSRCGTWVSCSTACGIFLDQRLNPYLLYWQADSLPPGKPHFSLY